MPQLVIADLNELRELVGQEVAVSEWLTVSQAMIDAFAEVTRDRQWIHVDEARAKVNPPTARRSRMAI